MKHVILIIILSVLILLGNRAYSQGDISLFAEEGTEWSVGNFEPNPSSPSDMIFVKMIGDTIIEDLPYHILRRNEYFFSETDMGEIAGFVRISETNVLFLRTLNEVEYKVFDYSLVYEDYAYLETFYGNSVTTQVCSYSINSYFGQSRRRWNICGVEPNYGSETWIEGIGPLSGILWANFGFEGLCGFSPQLLCAHLNGEQIYQNPSHDFCESFLPRFWDRFSLVGRRDNSWNVGFLDDSHDISYTDSVYIQYSNIDGDPYAWFYVYYYWVISSRVFRPESNSYVNDYFFAKVYADSLLYVKNRLAEEHLVFDFTAQTDDTLDLWSYDFYTDHFYPITAWIENTDSVFTSYGMRKSWRLTNEFGSTLWIKGIGNDEGLLRTNFALTGINTTETVLLCANYQTTQIYENPDFGVCSVSPVIQYVDNTMGNSEDFYVFPNPANDFLNISSVNPGFIAQLYDLTGNLVVQKCCIDRDCSIELNNLPSGIYILNILSSRKKFSQKVTKS